MVWRKEFPFRWYTYMYIATTWPISKSQKSYIEDTSDNAKVSHKSLLKYTKNKKGIEWVCGAYENFYEDNSPISKPPRILSLRWLDRAFIDFA